jgi:hypothetical protein
MNREMKQTDTNTTAKMDKPIEPGLPINIPFSIVRWIVYTICFAFLLIPFVNDRLQMICGGLILGWFASLLNAIANKKL